MSLLVDIDETRAGAIPAANRLPNGPLRTGLFFFFAYLALWAGHMDCGDSSFRIAWAKSMLFRHTARIGDAGLGAEFCKYSIGHSLLAMPFLGLAEVVRRVAHVRAEGPIYMLLFVLNAAVFMAMVARYLRGRFGPVETRRALLVIGFCTAWLPCSRMDSIEQFVLTFLFAGFLVLKSGRPALGILVASFAVAIRPDSVICVGLLAAWHLWAERDWSLAGRMALAGVPVLLVNAAANWMRWGTVMEAGYSGERFSEPFLVGLHGLLFSAGKSIFLYSPPLILGVAALVRFARKGPGSRDYWFFASVLMAEVALYSCWWDWSGDDCWGVRFINPGVVLMCIPCVEFLKGRRWPAPAAAFAIAGLAVQGLAVLVDPMASDYVVRHFSLPRVSVFPGKPKGATNRIDVEDMRFNPRYSPLAINWLMVRVLAGCPPALQRNALEIERTGTPLYDSLLASGWNPKTVESDLFWARAFAYRMRSGK